MKAAGTLALVVVLAGALAGDVVARIGSQSSDAPVWTEVAWPFPIDQWGTGRAFRCGASQCGAEVSVYLRPKLGFCNCTDGVYDDGELDRVADLELLGPKFSGLAAGRPVAVGWMKGRIRHFLVVGPYRPQQSALAIAFNDKCDVVVATVTADRDIRLAERAALDFLNADLVLRWTAAQLGL